jgi:ABC transport system ATP-binding/permease protein
MPLLTLLDGELAYGELPLLDRAAFSMESGERIGLIGRNGTGKSSLLGVIAGRAALDDGELRRRDGLTIALVEQEPVLPDRADLREALLARAAVAQEHKLNEFLHRFGLEPDLSPAALSGGERKRAALAAAFALEPELLLLDEPFGSLDPPTREDLIADLLPLLRRQATTTLLVTHDHDEAIELVDRLAVLLGGRLAQLDRPEHILEQPADPAVAAFVRPRGVRRTRDRDRGCERSATSGRDCQPGQPGHDARARGSDLTG